MNHHDHQSHANAATAPAQDGDWHIRKAGADDVEFVARMTLAATTPPFPGSMWDEFAGAANASGQEFLVAAYLEGAVVWGSLDETLIIERSGRAVGACAVYFPDQPADVLHPLDLEHSQRTFDRLHWSRDQREAFLTAYGATWLDGAMELEHPAPAVLENLGVEKGEPFEPAATRLINASKRVARDQGHDHLGFTYITGNDVVASTVSRSFSPLVTYHTAMFDENLPGVEKFRTSTG